jgi:hypothetical protein
LRNPRTWVAMTRGSSSPFLASVMWSSGPMSSWDPSHCLPPMPVLSRALHPCPWTLKSQVCAQGLRSGPAAHPPALRVSPGCLLHLNTSAKLS